MWWKCGGVRARGDLRPYEDSLWPQGAGPSLLRQPCTSESLSKPLNLDGRRTSRTEVTRY